MTYVIRKDGKIYVDVSNERSLLGFICNHIAAVADGVHITTDGDVLIRMGHGYTVERETGPKVVRLRNHGRINAEDKQA